MGIIETKMEKRKCHYTAIHLTKPLNNTGVSAIYNDNYDMQYIDVDMIILISSSSATLTVPDIIVHLVRYAGLYWSAVYVNNRRS